MKYFASSVILILLLQFISCNNSGSNKSTNPPDDNGQDISGCTDPNATNYNSEATIDDGSCDYGTTDIFGCTDSDATNYNPNATIDDGSCEYEEPVPGCTDPNAANYDPEATINDGSCLKPARVVASNMSYYQNSNTLWVSIWLTNDGDVSANNVALRFKLVYECNQGFFTGFTYTEILPSYYDVYNVGQIEPGQVVSYTSEQFTTLCGPQGFISIRWSVRTLTWD
jgi:hypothetical protein